MRIVDPDAPHVEAIRALAAGRDERPLLIALDGRSGVGKSTLALKMAVALRGEIVDSDSFYSGGTLADWHRSSATEKAERAIDWRRLRVDALEPLAAGRTARWHPFDWDAGEGLSPREVIVAPAPVVIVDGVYSGRPELADLIGVAVLVGLEDSVRRARLHARDAEWFDERWHAVWDEAEQHYFAKVAPLERFDVVVERD
ncbi:MAG TPA: hypothetical protein VGB64_05195 [Actinomycetota bacterium]